MNKKLFFLACAFLFATPIFSQGMWSSSTWPADSINIPQSEMKPFIIQLFDAGWKLSQKIDDAPTIGEKTYMVDGRDTIWRKTVVCYDGIIFECGANIQNFGPYWFTLTMNGVHIQWVPENGVAKLWTNWPGTNDEPNWGSETVNINEFNQSGDWQVNTEGRGQFTEADLLRVKSAIVTAQKCVPPYQASVASFYAKQDSLIRVATAKADAIPDYEDEGLTDTVKNGREGEWYVTYHSVAQGEVGWVWSFRRGTGKAEETYGYDNNLQIVYWNGPEKFGQPKPKMVSVWDGEQPSAPTASKAGECPYPQPPVNLSKIVWKK